MTDSNLLGEIMMRQIESRKFDDAQADMLENARRRAMGLVNEFDREMQHIRNDDRLSDVGRKSKQAELAQGTAESARRFFDPMLRQVADEIETESGRLAAVKLESADPVVAELRASEIRRGLADLDELELHVRLLDAGTSGNVELLNAVADSPLPMLRDRQPLADAQRAANEVKNPASAARLRNLQAAEGVLQTARQGVLAHVGADDVGSQLERIAAGEAA